MIREGEQAARGLHISSTRRKRHQCGHQPRTSGRGCPVDTWTSVPGHPCWTSNPESCCIIDLGRFKTAREKAYRRKTQEKGKGIFTCFHTAALPLCADAGSRSGTFQIFLENN